MGVRCCRMPRDTGFSPGSTSAASDTAAEPAATPAVPQNRLKKATSWLSSKLTRRTTGSAQASAQGGGGGGGDSAAAQAAMPPTVMGDGVGVGSFRAVQVRVSTYWGLLRCYGVWCCVLFSWGWSRSSVGGGLCGMCGGWGLWWFVGGLWGGGTTGCACGCFDGVALCVWNVCCGNGASPRRLRCDVGHVAVAATRRAAAPRHGAWFQRHHHRQCVSQHVWSSTRCHGSQH